MKHSRRRFDSYRSHQNMLWSPIRLAEAVCKTVVRSTCRFESYPPHHTPQFVVLRGNWRSRDAGRRTYHTSYKKRSRADPKGMLGYQICSVGGEATQRIANPFHISANLIRCSKYASLAQSVEAPPSRGESSEFESQGTYQINNLCDGGGIGIHSSLRSCRPSRIESSSLSRRTILCTCV